MRSLLILGLVSILGLSPPTVASSQDELSSVATVHFADGTAVALVQWKLTYEFATWKPKDSVSSAKTQVRETASLVLGKKSYPVKADTLSLSHLEAGEVFRVVSLNLKKVGNLKMEPPAREVLAPDLDKSLLFQLRSLDILGKTLSGIERGFCVASLSALVDCGGTRPTRVVGIDFD